MKDIITRKKQIKSMCPIFVNVFVWHRKSMVLYIIKTDFGNRWDYGRFNFSSGGVPSF